MATENLRNTMVTVDAMKTANKEIKRQYVSHLFRYHVTDCMAAPDLRYGKIDIDKIEVGCERR
jgi:hypothetical protein